MVVPVEVKTCTCCKVAKTLDLFSKDKSRKDGRSYHCRECQAAKHQRLMQDPQYAEKIRRINAKNYAENKERYRATGKIWTERNWDKVRSYQAEYRAANAEKIEAGKIEYRKKNAERLREKAKRYYHANKEQVNTRKKLWDSENKERRKAHLQKYYEENKDLFTAAAGRRRAATLKRTPAWLTDEDFFRMETMYLYTKSMAQTTGRSYHVDHILPLRGKYVSGLHVPDNLQVLEASENIRKNNRWVPE